MRQGSSRLLLLDVNVLIALCWPNHQFHAAAHRRLGRPGQRWATCALTQLGFIRLSSNPAVTGVRKTPQEAVAILASLIRDPNHVYLKALPSPAEPRISACFARILGYQQVTDAYLLELAARNGATLLTFDSRLLSLASGKRVEVLGVN